MVVAAPSMDVPLRSPRLTPSISNSDGVSLATASRRLLRISRSLAFESGATWVPVRRPSVRMNQRSMVTDEKSPYRLLKNDPSLGPSTTANGTTSSTRSEDPIDLACFLVQPKTSTRAWRKSFTVPFCTMKSLVFSQPMSLMNSLSISRLVWMFSMRSPDTNSPEISPVFFQLLYSFQVC